MPEPIAARAETDLLPAPRDLTADNTLGLPCHASRWVRLASESQLPALSRLAQRAGRLVVLGGGSNVVLPERLDALVVQVALPGIRLVGQTADAWIVEAGAGESWHGFVTETLSQGWEGLENLALIPGTVGAAPVQNIGAYGVELADRFHSLRAWDVCAARMVEMTAEQCRYGYRDSVFKHEPDGRWIIASVRFALPRPWRPVLGYPDLRNYPSLDGSARPPTARDVYDAVCAVRRAKLPDPAALGNAGSFFKNPVVTADVCDALRARFPGLVWYPQPDGRCKLAAGWLIDQCGWKGRRLGRAGVHDRQALVLVNHGGATAADILALAEAVRRDVRARFGIDLEMEPRAV